MNRSISADLIKTLSIFGVVFIHGSGLLGINSNFQVYAGNFFHFCVPCFILIWAYFLEKSYKKIETSMHTQFLFSKFKHLFIVFTIWSLMYFFLLVDWNAITLKDLITKHFSGYGWSGQYFFIILFQLIIFYPLIRWTYHNKCALWVSVILIMGLYFLYGFFNNILPDFISKLGDRPFIFWVPYVFAGIAIANQKIKKLSSLFILMLLLIPLETSLIGFERSAYITLSVLVSSIFLCWTLLPKNINFSPNLNKIISYVGKNTMIIFVSNPIIIVLLNPIIPHDIFSNSIIWKIILPFVSTTIVILICLLLNWIIEKIKLKGILT